MTSAEMQPKLLEFLAKNDNSILDQKAEPTSRSPTSKTTLVGPSGPSER